MWSPLHGIRTGHDCRELGGSRDELVWIAVR